MTIKIIVQIDVEIYRPKTNLFSLSIPIWFIVKYNPDIWQYKRT